MTFPIVAPYPSRRSPVMADNVVATSQPLAAQAGLEMLRLGGNAVDAALAAAAALTVVEPTGNGLGSDAFAILWDGSELHGLNASGRSPAGWSPERFAGREAMPERGWEAVTVPGAVGAWMALNARFGTLPFETLLAPAIRLAEGGFAVTPMIAATWARSVSLKAQPGFARTFLPGGRAPAPGERFANPAAGADLRRIAATRGEAFYRGEIAERIVAEAPDWCGTVRGAFDGAELHEIPPNGQGIAACMALGILEHLPVRCFGPDEPEAVHLMIEAMKLALRDAEEHVADLSAMTSVGVEDLLSPGYLAERAALIDAGHAQDFGAGAPRAGGTVYLTAADASGMMISFIQSNYMGFGSGVVPEGTGVSLQNRGCGFSLDPGSQNVVGPRKRPFHTIIPGFLMKNGAPEMSFGVMGGPMQAQGHVQMVLRTQLWNQDVQSAADAPRWRITQGLGVACEQAMDPALVASLRAMGHQITLESPDVSFGFGGAQLIRRLPGGGYSAGSDPRKDGCAAGF